MSVVAARGVTKIYQEARTEIVAVQGVDLTAERGEVVGVMGPSGSGKTTLLSMLGCILRPTNGAIAICGETVSTLDERGLSLVRRRHIGFVFQNFNLFAALTAAENVEVALKLKGVGRTAARRQAMRLLAAVALEQRAGSLPRDLSGGEKQRVSIARALAGEPNVILADEPTASLDWKNGVQVVALLKEASINRLCTVIIVTHDQRIVPYLDRVLHLEDGRLVA